ncbi:MAG: hypothetical protein PV344_03590 [Anaplasma sp.]|nr:hypothetical protein [Anaplasma sp.]
MLCKVVLTRFGCPSKNIVLSYIQIYCKRLNFRGLKFSRIGPKLKI